MRVMMVRLTKRELFWVGITLLVTALVAEGLEIENAKVAEKKKAKHPGCFVWWFLNDCPLGKMFGVDPFGIYPWKKFCAKYSSMVNLEQCEKYKEIVVSPRESETGKSRSRRSTGLDHPGCSYFWFLPGCPMASLFGTDPFNSYPWQTLCQFRRLQSNPRCRS